MKRKFLLIAMCGILGACAPQNQISLLNNKSEEMADIRKSCAESTAQEEKPRTAAVKCRFDSFESLLRESNFKDMDLLNDLRFNYINIAQQVDAKRITEDQADTLFKQAGNQFNRNVQQRDTERTRRFVGAMAAISDGFNQAPRYAPAPMPSYNNGASCPACQQGIEQGQAMVDYAQRNQPVVPTPSSLMDSYNHPQLQQPTNAERLRDCAHTGSCLNAFVPPSANVPYQGYNEYSPPNVVGQ